MATLQNIRNRAGFLVAVIGIAMLAFILGDLLTSGTTIFNKARDKAFEVNGEVISTQDYFDRVTEWENFQKMVSGENSSRRAVRVFPVPDTAWKYMLAGIMMM